MVVWILHFPCTLVTEDAAAEIAKDRAFLCVLKETNPNSGCAKKKIS